MAGKYVEVGRIVLSNHGRSYLIIAGNKMIGQITTLSLRELHDGLRTDVPISRYINENCSVKSGETG